MRPFGTLTLNTKGLWEIEAEPHVIIRLKRVFSKIAKSQHGTIVLADTLENAQDLAWFIERYPLTVTPPDYLERRSSEAWERSERLVSIFDGNFEPRPFQMKIPPRDYQKIAAEATLQAGSLLLADEVGLGKTCSAIAVLTEPHARPALVVTLTHLPNQWLAEIQRFAPGLIVHILKKGQPYDLQRGWRGRRLPFPDIIISNYHKLSGWAEALAGVVKALVFDEVQELRRGPSSDKFAAAKHIADKAAIRMGLSATPIYNFGSEIYNVLSVLNPAALGTHEEFIREFCKDTTEGQSGQHAIKDPKAFGTYVREQGLMLRRTRKDVGRELPPVITVSHAVDTDRAPLAEIESAAADLARLILSQAPEEVRGERMRASEELSWKLRMVTGIAKAPYIAEFVRMLVEQGEQVLLFLWHREVYSIMADRLKDLNPAFFTGEESTRQKEEAAKRFIAGDSKVLCMSLRAGAGIDGLQGAAHVVVFGELDWSPAVHQQAIGRLARDGQDESVVAYYLVADEGSDPTVSATLGLKQRQSDGILDPNADLIERLQSDGDRVKRLAAAYLQQRGMAAPEAAEATVADPPLLPAVVSPPAPVAAAQPSLFEEEVSA